MRSIAQVCLGLAVVALVLAVIFALWRIEFVAITAEGLSRACSNLALLSIGFFIAEGKRGNMS